MSRPTVVIAAGDLEGERVEISGDSYRHLFRSRRLAVGAELRLVDGRGAARWGEVASVGRRRAVVVLGKPAPDNEATVAVELWVGVPRPRRAAWLVEKATEIGVAAVRWLDTVHGGRDLPTAALERHHRVAVAAVEQSSRSAVPEITGLHSWDDLVGELDRPVPTVVLNRAAPEGAEGETSNVAAWRGAGAVRLIVGPEGGLGRNELTELEKHGVADLTLGERVLRVETAAVVGTALILWLAGQSHPTPL